MWFKKKKEEFMSVQFDDSHYGASRGVKIGTQINKFQEKGYEFVSVIGSYYDDHSNCNRANVLFRKT